MEQIRDDSAQGESKAENPQRGALYHGIERAFGITSPLSNKAMTVSAFLFMGFAISLVLWRFAGINWTRYAGAACFFGSFASCAVAFAAQTGSQAIRGLEYGRAKRAGEEPRIFREGDPAYAKLFKKAFRMAWEKHKDSSRSLAATSRKIVQTSGSLCQPRANARAYRSPSRPAFAHASSSSGGGGSDGDGSGDPPERQNNVTPSDSPERPNRTNKNPHPLRSPGSCSIPWRPRFQRGRP